MTKFYSDDTKLDFSDVLIVPGKNSTEVSAAIKSNNKDILSRNDVSLISSFRSDPWTRLAGSKVDTDTTVKILAVPIIASNMDGVGTVEMHNQLRKNKMMTSLVKSITDDELDTIQEPELAFLTIGINESDLDRVEQHKHKFKNICIDTPNGYLPNIPHFVSRVRETCGDKAFIMVGNIVTSEHALNLYMAGADCVKVGIGPGSVCTTRIKTGVGYPQLSAILEVSKQARQINLSMRRKLFVCSDGGCTNPGDIAKAFVSGADFVMLGGMLAGHDEGGGEIIKKYVESDERMMHPQGSGFVPVIDEKKYVQFYGMSSKTANDKHNGGLKGYRAAEGKEVLIPYKGPVQDTIDDILGGLRSACTYINSPNLRKMSVFGKFVKVNNQVNNVFK